MAEKAKRLSQSRYNMFPQAEYARDKARAEEQKEDRGGTDGR
jgi:hypothetical protein